MREFVSPVEKGVQVFVGATCGRRVEAPVPRLLSAAFTDVAVAGAGIVDADLVVREAAQALMDWLSDSLAEQVPQRDVHGGRGAHLHAAAAEAEILILQRPGMTVDLQRGLPEQQRRHGLMDLRLDSAGAKEGLPESDQSLVGVDVDPEQIGKLPESDRLEGRDLHGVSSRALHPSGQSLLDRSNGPPRRFGHADTRQRPTMYNRPHGTPGKRGGAGLARFGRARHRCRLQNGCAEPAMAGGQATQHRVV